MRRPALLIAASLCCCGRTEDVRSLLLASAKAQDPDFPDGRNVQLTRFAYIGAMDTPEGPVHVVQRLAVLTGMLAPRGIPKLDFYDRNHRLLASLWWPGGEPLWCEGSKVYLFGSACEGPFPADDATRALFEEDECPGGNVIDLSEGFRKAVLRLEKRYGSSGGIEYDPRARQGAR
jgi:hypothetical protein